MAAPPPGWQLLERNWPAPVISLWPVSQVIIQDIFNKKLVIRLKINILMVKEGISWRKTLSLP